LAHDSAFSLPVFGYFALLVAPETAYLVCATPRSGSTLLCELLRETGVAGSPLEHFETLRHSGLPRQPREYFDGVEDRGLLDLLPDLREPASEEPDPQGWWNGVLEAGSSANGVWGGKLMWGHAADLVGRATPLTGREDLKGVLDALLGEVRFVHVTRSDTVAQAVSLWKAVQTEEWRDGKGGDGSSPPEYSFAALDHLRRQLEHQDAAWRGWFAEEGVEPLHIGYEELEADPRAAARSVLKLIGVEAEVPEPPLRRQGDECSERWAERYRAEVA
jgi:trehalose 2-sulfotransferase